MKRLMNIYDHGVVGYAHAVSSGVIRYRFIAR